MKGAKHAQVGLNYVAGLMGAALLTSSGTGRRENRQPDGSLEQNLGRDPVRPLGHRRIVFGLIAIYLLIRYRAKSPDQVGEPVQSEQRAMWAWALIPAALFMADDFLLAGKGWTLWNIQRTVPSNALEVKVTGIQWSFEFDYGNGVTDRRTRCRRSASRSCCA